MCLTATFLPFYALYKRNSVTKHVKQFKQKLIMSNTLCVIEPFFVMEVGDTLELSEDGNSYVYTRNEEFHKHGDDNGDINSTYSSTFTISKEYAASLIKEGFLEEVYAEDDKVSKNAFVNVFDEISKLLAQYKDELKNIDEDFANMPECVKVEKTTVLNNLIKVLSYLKGLKK